MYEVSLDSVAHLSDDDRAAVRELTLAVYSPERHADWPGREVGWATPRWCVRVRGADGGLACFAGVYLRDATWDGRAVRVGGVGNVKTHPAARRRGYGGAAVRRAVEFFDEQGADFALLVCEPLLTGYYARLGWAPFAGRLLVRQGGAVAEFTLNRAMTLGVRSAGPASGTIDLCGPPW